MRYAIFFIILSIMFFGFSHRAWSEDMNMHHQHSMGEDVSRTSEDEIEDAGNTVCPIMGGQVDKGVNYVYEGKRYYFCCPGCIEAFKNNPEKYIEKIKKEKTWAPTEEKH